MLDENASMDSSFKPYAIPDNAFEQLRNAYVFRGRVRKRFGSRLMEGTSGGVQNLEQLESRFRINIGTTSVGGALAGTVPGSIFQVGQMFSVGSQFYTVTITGTPAAMINTGAGSGTYNTTTGAYSFTGAPVSTIAYFYPAQPVMGLTSYPTGIVSQNATYGFDTQFAYKFTTTGWSRLGTAVWTGNNYNFFWSVNFRGLTSNLTYLYTTNFNAGATLSDSDTMRYWNGSIWSTFNPRFSSTITTSTVLTCRIIIPFKNRLLLLNVVENIGVAPGSNATYVNRCRFSWLGDPTDLTAFYTTAGKGGFEDAPTKEAIITAQFIKDRLIVYFESSTWELAYTGNEVRPFVWQQINTELGAESTFSQVPFDKVVLGIGNVGIHACNGSNVERIDQKIPTAVFEIHNGDKGVQRVAGIRDYYTEMVYWSFPSIDRSSTFPYNNRVLIYNYKTGSWAFNDDSITAFGYFQTTVNEGSSWASYLDSWEESSEPWVSPALQDDFQQIIAGNQQGFVFIVDSDSTRNAPSLQITNITGSGIVKTITCINHNLQPGFNAEGDYIIIENVNGMTGINGLILPVNEIIDANTFTVVISTAVSGSYLGAGTIARVSNIEVLTKQYNFYAQQGLNTSFNKVDFFVDKTSNGQVIVDYAVSSSGESLLFFGAANGSLLGSGVLETAPYALTPLEITQSRLWHPIYPMTNGECIQLKIYMDDGQLRNSAIAWSDFQLHAMVFYAQPLSRLS